MFAAGKEAQIPLGKVELLPDSFDEGKPASAILATTKINRYALRRSDEGDFTCRSSRLIGYIIVYPPAREFDSETDHLFPLKSPSAYIALRRYPPSSAGLHQLLADAVALY